MIDAPEQYPTKRDQRLLSRAIKERWPIPEDTKQRALNSINEILKLPTNQNNISVKMAAIGNLTKIDNLNVKMEIAAMPKHVIHRQIADLTDAELTAAIISLAEEMNVAKLIECEISK